jgi:TIR domain
MNDIFLSFATEDRQQAAKLVAVFEQEGWAVWWDPSTITPGANYAEVVMDEIGRSTVVVALWSQAARNSFLVTEVLIRTPLYGLVLVLVEKVELPQLIISDVFDLSDWVWGGPSWETELRRLVRRVRAFIAASSPPAETRAASDTLPQLDIGNELRLQKKRADLPSKDGSRFRGVFISYRRDEAAAYARGLYDRLAARFGRGEIFLDLEKVGWGEDFVEAITEAAESCAVMIVLVSRQWARGAGEKAEEDDYVRLEVAAALGRKVRVIPILIQGAAMPAPKELPADLAPLLRRNALALSDARWERDVEDLMKTLEGLLKG